MDKRKKLIPPFRVGFLLINGFALMSYSACVEMLRAANLLADRTLYDIRHIPASGFWAVSSSGAVVEAPCCLGEDLDFELVLVVAGGDPANYKNKKVFHWLRQLARHGVTLGGVSGGPIILASAGLMNNRRMTVHWEHAPALDQIVPKLTIERSIYVIDRDRVTCAGGVAPLDLMHALLTDHHGSRFARQVSDWFMHTVVRPSGDPQRAGITERYGTTDLVVTLAIEIMENHCADPLSLGHIGGLVERSPRQLNRLFQAKLGKSTMSFYRRLRLEKAYQLLIQTSLKTMDIALMTGFANPAHFARCFRAQYNVSPSSLRPVLTAARQRVIN